MNAPAWMLLIAFLAFLLLSAWPLARVMEAIVQGRFAWGRRVEARLYRLAGAVDLPDSHRAVFRVRAHGRRRASGLGGAGGEDAGLRRRRGRRGRVTTAEQQGKLVLATLRADTAASTTQAGGSMEGKKVRFGINASALFATVSTAASCGAVNSMHDSCTPLGGAVPMVMMQPGEVIFGGVGSGLYGMLMFAANLRKKVEDAPSMLRHLLTEAGIGYRFRPWPAAPCRQTSRPVWSSPRR